VADFYATEFAPVDAIYKSGARSTRQIAGDFRIAIHNGKHGFTQTELPVDGCIVLLGKNKKLGIHHCGIYMAGSVLHAAPSSTMYEPLSVIKDKFALIQYWVKK
jgi:hypothetical protein